MYTPITYVDQVDQIEALWNERVLNIDFYLYYELTFEEWFNQLSNSEIVFHLRQL